MSPNTRVARRRPTALPQIFASTRFPDVAQIMENALGLFPEFPAMAELTQVGLFPTVNVTEDPTIFTVTAELAGLAADDVHVDFTDGVLTIQGDKTEERTEKGNGTKYHVWERRSGSFQRSFPFPGGVAGDKITADMKDGVLTILLPKATQEQARRRSIKINTK
jgi:HSP20 family molecular chaperone IbpA